MARDEEEEGGCYPNPSDFDKVDVKYVALFGEVTGCVVRGVALEGGDVGCNVVVDSEGAEEGAKEEGSGVEGEKDCFERRG